MLFFFSFERLTWKGHGFLYPWFSFLPMTSCDEVFSSIFLVSIGCFFFSHLGRIILLLILFGLSTIFSFSIGGGYTIRINNGFFAYNKIIGVVSFLVFLLLLFLLRRANNLVFYLHLRILLDPLRNPLWIERDLGVCSTPSLY